jgi:hypothetical protein
MYACKHVQEPVCACMCARGYAWYRGQLDGQTGAGRHDGAIGHNHAYWQGLGGFVRACALLAGKAVERQDVLDARPSPPVLVWQFGSKGQGARVGGRTLLAHTEGRRNE